MAGKAGIEQTKSSERHGDEAAFVAVDLAKCEAHPEPVECESAEAWKAQCAMWRKPYLRGWEQDHDGNECFSPGDGFGRRLTAGDAGKTDGVRADECGYGENVASTREEVLAWSDGIEVAARWLDDRKSSGGGKEDQKEAAGSN